MRQRKADFAESPVASRVYDLLIRMALKRLETTDPEPRTRRPHLPHAHPDQPPPL